jgi:hypothetical protein
MSSPTKWKYARLAYIIVVTSWSLYAVLTLFAPSAANAHYHLSEPALIALKLTVIIPIHLIWLMAVRGAVAFKNYSIMIRGGRESGAVNLIADGLLWTLGYLVLTTVIGSIAPYLVDKRYYDTFVVIRDHLAPLASVIAFVLIYRGSDRLRETADFTTWTRNTTWLVPAYGVFAYLFVLQFVATPADSGQLAARSSTSIVGHEILLFTLIVPLLAAWFIGLVAAINITKYAHVVKGVIYRQALRDLARGVLTVIAFSIVIQLISFGARYFASYKLSTVLGIVYLLILLYGLGFVFVRSGARKLALIEATSS